MSTVDVAKEEISFRDVSKPYFKRWHWFLISIFLFSLLAYAYIMISVPVYKVETTTLIKDAKKMSSASGDFNVLQGIAGFGGMATNSIENELAIFKSRRLVNNVVRELNLQTTIIAPQKFYDVELYKDTSPIIVNVVNEKPFYNDKVSPIELSIEGDKLTLTSKSLKAPIVATYNKLISLPYANIIIRKNTNFNSEKVKNFDNLANLKLLYTTFDERVTKYQKALEVGLVDKEGTIIKLGMKHSNTDLAKDVLNKLVYWYNYEAIQDKNIESNKTKEFIDERIAVISKELGDVESERERFKINNNIVDIPAEARINLQTQNEAARRQLALQTEIQVANMLLGYVNKLDYRQVIPANVGVDNEGAVKAIETYNQLVLQRNKLLESATEENPLVVDLTKQISEMRKAIREGLNKHVMSLNMASREMGVQEGISNYKIKQFPTQEKLFRNIERQQQIKESLYLLLLEKREEAAISMAMTSDKARVVDAAFADRKAVAPNKPLIMLGGLVLGLLLPFGFIYLNELFNDKIISKQDLEKLTKTPILVELPRVGRNGSELVEMNDVSPMAEAFRILTTNMNFMLPKKESAKIIFITSTVKGEGKTFVSVNTALSLASPKNKVLIIGSDIRNPQLQRYNTSRVIPAGLTEFLANAIDDTSEIIHQSPFNPNCDIIYSGSIPPNPTDLLENGRYQELIRRLETQYDYIIVDSAPLMLVTDSFLISDVADVTIYVTRSEKTEKDLIDFANKNIESERIKNTAFVLNDVHKSNFGYGNKYGYGYHATEKKWYEKLFNR